MATFQHDLVRSFLLPSENLQCILDVELAAENTGRTDPTVTSFRRRLIAVVTRLQDIEVGSLLVLNASDTNGGVRAVDALPITEHLALAVAQTGSLDSQMAEIPTETWSAWLLTIKRDAQDTRPLAFIVGTRDTQRLQSFTAECRRLKEIATSNAALFKLYIIQLILISRGLRHMSQTRHLDVLTFAFVNNPCIHACLQPSLAFLETMSSDISIVRRDWIQHAAAKEASSSNVNHLKCVITLPYFLPPVHHSAEYVWGPST
ncbi:hypothetical protein J3R82DRAFT_8110 [Butyriboletus roseoflavus]|nr:hypothetical protein J3R82DRAFT_8110 [Butyriboletus roseoflavus]